MPSNNDTRIGKSLVESFRALRSAFGSLYELAPLAVIVGTMLVGATVWLVVKWQPLILATIVLVVLAISIGIFVARRSFGEAMVSLIGGLFTAFSVDWTTERFVAFIVAWAAFMFVCLLVASVAIAAKTEDIYRQAGLRLVGSGNALKPMENRLKEIASSKTLGMLGPVERAELIRLFCFRNVPVDLFLPCLRGVETLSVITKCDIQVVGIFVADFLTSFAKVDTATAQGRIDQLYRTIRDCPVPPQEFFDSFERSRRLLLSCEMEPEKFLTSLAKCLKSGLDPDETYSEMQSACSVEGKASVGGGQGNDEA